MTTPAAPPGLMAGADWPLMARHLASLQQAGVDLTTFLPNLGRMASAVEQAVARNTARIQAEGTDRWADLLRRTRPEGLVRDAILASPAWPDLAAEMGHLHEQGVDVARILTDAHAAGLGVDQAAATARTSPPPRAQAPAPSPTAPTPVPAPAVRTAPAPATTPAAAPAPAVRTPPAPAAAPAPAPDPWAARPVPPVSTDAKRAWGPLTEGLKIPRDLDLADRAHALDQLGISTGAHRLLVSRVNEALPERDAALLVSSRVWPLLAHRMHTMAKAGEPFTAHLARLAPDTAAWRTGPPADTAKSLLLAAHHALTTPLDAPLPTGPASPPRQPAPAPPPPAPTTPRASSRPPPNPPTTGRPPPHHGRDADGRAAAAPLEPRPARRILVGDPADPGAEPIDLVRSTDARQHDEKRARPAPSPAGRGPSPMDAVHHYVPRR
ncbi:hypothetical protein ACIQU8_31025 [Streptomyces griseus]|uniref:hypothetical protein n=1 Tax=Streptomyces griseus TaxID=1911 RepID=UPI0037F9C634